jgi:hypothetical protein
MYMTKGILIIFSSMFTILVGFGFIFLNKCEDDWCFVFEWQKIKATDSFERCASLDFSIIESYPRQCRAGDKLFTEIVPVSNDKIKVSTPLPNAVVKSPLIIAGEARGNWYFEASFPIKLYDSNGNQVGIAVAQAKSEWMTTDFVPFESIITFEKPKTATGILTLEKDNPSGLLEHADSISIPIIFQ